MMTARKMTDRSIIHINVADFAVAVERGLDRRLDDRPVIVAPQGAARATVVDMSEEAYQAGVRKHMPLSRALGRCRDARVLMPHPDRYRQAMARMLKSALPCSPFIELGDGDGHLFVDITGSSRLLGPPVDVAWRLSRWIRRDLGLAPIWSLATSKLIAKTATRLVKPLGEYIVEPGDEAAFLAPLPLFLVPGIESSDLIRLNDFNITRVFQATTLNTDQMQTLLGRRGTVIHDRLQGIDPSPVRPVNQPSPRVVHYREFGDDTNDRTRVERSLYRLVERAGRQLRCQTLAARRIGLILEHTDGVRRIRQVKATPATANDFSLFAHARRVLTLAWTRRVRLQRMTLICDRLIYPPAQRFLFASERNAAEKQVSLVAAMDRIRRRFGSDALAMGRAIDGQVGCITDQTFKIGSLPKPKITNYD
jgi:DNA polymerase-4